MMKYKFLNRTKDEKTYNQDARKANDPRDIINVTCSQSWSNQATNVNKHISIAHDGKLIVVERHFERVYSPWKIQ